MNRALRTIFLFLLAAAGFSVSAMLLVWFYAPALSLAGISCSGSGGCDKIAGSAYSSFLDIPVALYGMYFYVFLLITLAVRRLSPAELDGYYLAVLVAASALALVADTGLAVLMIKTGSFCKFCLLTYGLNMAICVMIVLDIKTSVKTAGGFKGYLSLKMLHETRAYATIAFLYGIIVLLMIPALDSMNITIKNYSTNRYNSQKLIDKTVKDAYGRIFVQSELPDTYMTEGNPQGKVKIVVFTDFICSACRQWHVVAGKLLRDFGEDISIRYYVFPLDAACNDNVSRTVYKNSCYANSAVLFAAGNNRFNEMNEYNFSGLKAQAEKIRDGNLSFYDNFFKEKGMQAEYITDSDIKQMMKKHVAAAKSRSISSTPYIFINGHPVDGIVPYEAFRRIVKMELSNQ